MTINTRSKMQRTNGHVRKWLKANGYRNLYFFPHSFHSKDWHMTYGEDTADFDGIAHNDNHILVYQCKSNCRAPKKTLSLYEKLSKKFNIKVYWINKPDRKPLEINNQPQVK